MIAVLDWEMFHSKYLNQSTIFVKEDEYSWDMYTQDGIFIIYSSVYKTPDQEENMMFVERYLANRDNIIKCQALLNQQEEPDEIDEPVEEVEKDDFEVELEPERTG